MSLKGFHLVFVTVSTLLFGFLALWSFLLAKETSSIATFLGFTGVTGALLMPAYGVYFYRKINRIHL
jgi:hypothetical protein